jgi:hypothetical protein
MNRGILGWILFPGAYLTLNFGGDGGGGSGSSSREDEERKSALRTKIDRLYGIGSPVTKYRLDDGTLVDTAPTPVTRQKTYPDGTPVGNPDNSQDQAGQPVYETIQPHYTTETLPDTEAAGASSQMQAEDAQVSDATRGYYSDQLSRSFAAAERNNRFNLARQGLQGGSADVDSNANLQTDQNLGLTRIDQAARAAAASLDTQREQERLNAVNLVNAGAGEDAVASAAAGLKGSLANIQNQSRANIFSDLFAGGADTFAAQNQASALANMGALYNQRLAYFYPGSGTSSGRVTPG